MRLKVRNGLVDDVVELFLREEGLGCIELRAQVPDGDSWLLLRITAGGVALAGSVPRELGFALDKRMALKVDGEVC